MPVNLSTVMAAPTCTVEIGFASSALTPLASVTWTDVTEYVLAFNTKMGRQHELNRVEASTADITLNNNDRRFDPSNTSSPYNPNILPMKRIRIRATWNSTTYPIYCGYIETWPMVWDVTSSTVTIHASDVLGKVLGLNNLQTPYVEAVLADNPTAYYRFHENSGAAGADDSAPNNYQGTYQGQPTLGGPGPVTDGASSAVLFNGSTSDGIYTPVGAGVSGTGAFTAECLFKSTVNTWLFRQDVAVGGWRLMLNPNLTFQTYNAIATVTLSPANNFLDGNWHHVLATRSGTTLTLIVDGVSIGTTSATASNIVQARISIGNTDADPTWSVSMEEPAFYSTALSVARGLFHSQAAASWANDLSGARVNRLLDSIGWPAADRSIEAGNSTLQAEPTPGNVLTCLQATADSENGLLYQDPTGNIAFLQRTHLWTVATSTVSQATFGDGAGELPYVPQGLTPVMDDLDLWNDIQATRTGGVMQEAQDLTSQGTYGTRTLTVSNMKVASDLEVIARAQYDLARYKAPLMRLRAFTITPLSDTTNLFPQALGRALWDRVTFRRRPIGGGPAFSQDSFIEGISHTYTKADWKTTFALSPADPNGNLYFTLNSATRGLLDTSLLAY